MSDREKVIQGLEHCKRESEHIDDNPCNGCPYYELKECQQMMAEALALLKEQKVPEELKLKIWNALYTKEDEYEKKLIEADKCHEWFSIYRPWLQIGFNIAIDAIAEWKGQ